MNDIGKNLSRVSSDDYRHGIEILRLDMADFCVNVWESCLICWFHASGSGRDLLRNPERQYNVMVTGLIANDS